MVTFSSDLSFTKSNYFTPRLKIIMPLKINNTDKINNEDINSITFNYQNQFSENQFEMIYLIARLVLFMA